MTAIQATTPSTRTTTGHGVPDIACSMKIRTLQPRNDFVPVGVKVAEGGRRIRGDDRGARGPAISDGEVSGWYIPTYVAEAHPDINTGSLYRKGQALGMVVIASMIGVQGLGLNGASLLS
jgi:hypothetical protein